ncbi:hypothetical protein [Burkholderia cepacia]|uniref:hypothetical protein n=1 Tax=Burkholderia cepacia TaxID=292 RepID=UPI00075421FB|nr:hypothetical protein [Burkholderia cepacia]
MTDEILPVHRYARDGGDFAVKCPHCDSVLYVEGGDWDGTPRGEQYQHANVRFPDVGCKGWMAVTSTAQCIKEL